MGGGVHARPLLSGYTDRRTGGRGVGRARRAGPGLRWCGAAGACRENAGAPAGAPAGSSKRAVWNVHAPMVWSSQRVAARKRRARARVKAGVCARGGSAAPSGTLGGPWDWGRAARRALCGRLGPRITGCRNSVRGPRGTRGRPQRPAAAAAGRERARPRARGARAGGAEARAPSGRVRSARRLFRPLPLLLYLGPLAGALAAAGR